MNTAWKWGGGTILQAGLMVLFTAGAWAGDLTTFIAPDGMPRALQAAPSDAYALANQQDPPPPTPAEFKSHAANTDKAPRADGTAKPAAPLAADCGACGEGCERRGGGLCRWFDIGDEDCDNCCPWWSATVGAMILHRSGARNYTIGNGPFSSGQFDEAWGSGPRFEIARRYQEWDLEFVYWGVENWNDELSTATPVREFASYKSRLYNWEWNLKRKIEPVTFLAGIRYMELQERLYSEEVGAQTTVDLRRAANCLYGFQVGAEAELARRDRFSLDAFTKVGVFSNHIHESATSMTSSTHNETALVGEAGLNAKVKINKNLTAYGGYEVMWLDGVVLAPDTLGVVALGQTALNTPFYHGANFGLEFRW